MVTYEVTWSSVLIGRTDFFLSLCCSWPREVPTQTPTWNFPLTRTFRKARYRVVLLIQQRLFASVWRSPSVSHRWFMPPKTRRGRKASPSSSTTSEHRSSRLRSVSWLHNRYNNHFISIVSFRYRRFMVVHSLICVFNDCILVSILEYFWVLQQFGINRVECNLIT